MCCLSEWEVCKCGLLFLGGAFCYPCFGKKQSILSEASCENESHCRLIFMLVRCELTKMKHLFQEYAVLLIKRKNQGTDMLLHEGVQWIPVF